MKKNLMFLLLLMFSVVQVFSQSPSLDKRAHTYKNLSLFVLRTLSAEAANRTYLTLEEAMSKNLVELHETGTVSKLTIDNKSEKHVFIMAGDIVKGGKQDRTIVSDMVLKPKEKGVSLQSFCVESSRWKQRGLESVSKFSSSTRSLSNRNLKIAARESKSQQAVWNEVSAYQKYTGANVRADVKNKASATSLQLTLESKELQSAVKDYENNFSKVFDGGDIVGFAFCINGKISTIEWFGDRKLFDQLRQKLLTSAINEAVFSHDAAGKFRVPTSSEIEKFIQNSKKGKIENHASGGSMLERRHKMKESTMFSTYDTDFSTNRPIHTSIYYTGDIKPVQSEPAPAATRIYQNTAR